MDDYGSPALIEAIKKALSHHAYGADYIENILYQEMTPQRQHPPLRLNQEALNRIRLQEPSLAEYDALLSITGPPCGGRSRISFSRPAGLKPLLPGYQRQTSEKVYHPDYKFAVRRLVENL
jgi:hypothetical protein